MSPAPRRVGRRTAPPQSARQGVPIHSVSEGESRKLSMLIYGEPGIGKTRNFAGECGKLGRTLIIRPPVDHTDSIIDTDNVDEWVVRSWSEMDDVLIYARTDGADVYDWFWLDSLSLWSDQGIDDIWEQLISDKPHRARWGLDQGEYWLNMQRIQRWVRHMVGCPDWHFGMTAHVEKTRVSEDPSDYTEKLMPYLQGKNMAAKMCGYMNVVGYYHWEEVGRGGKKTRVLSLNQTDDYYAKDQFDASENGRIINPDIVKYMGGTRFATAHRTTTKRPKRRPTRSR